MQKFNDLQDRLVTLAVNGIGVAEMLPNTRAGQHMSDQLMRSSTALAQRYAAQGINRQTFIKKLQDCLGELRITYTCLQIITEANMVLAEKVQTIMDECDHLIAIFIKSIVTAEKNNK